MDLILQKGTELGVTAFVPVFSDRSEVKLDGARATKRLEHWRGVVVSACEQSGRAWVPGSAAAGCARECIDGVGSDDAIVASIRWRRCCRTALAADQRDIVLAVGPEGGWSPQDRSLLEAQGFLGVALAHACCARKTAGLAAIAALQALHGDFD